MNDIMSKSLLYLNALDININSVLIFLNPPLPHLNINNVKLTLNDVTFTSFSLQDENLGRGKKHKIIPLDPFNPNEWFRGIFFTIG